MNYSRIVFSTGEQLEKNNDHKPIVVCNCGYYIAHNQFAPYKIQPRVNEWLLVYLHKGRIQLPLHNNYIVKDGTILIFPPNSHIYYNFLEDETNERYYIYFKGTYISSYMQQLHLTEPSGIYTIEQSKTLISYFFEIMNDFKLHGFDEDIFRSTLLLRLLAHVHKKLPHVSKKLKENMDLYWVIEDMEKNYWKELSLEYYTKQLNISTTAFIRNFKQLFHFTPYSYLSNIRLEQSKNLLLTTPFSISEIALQVGFADPLHFCKFFKKATNLSPSDYRKQYVPQ